MQADTHARKIRITHFDVALCMHNTSGVHRSLLYGSNHVDVAQRGFTFSRNEKREREKYTASMMQTGFNRDQRIQKVVFNIFGIGANNEER